MPKGKFKKTKCPYERVTEKILNALEGGVIPWVKPWGDKLGAMPRSLATEKTYRGLNFMLLAMEGRSSPYWLTFRKARELGGSIKKGEKSAFVTFFKMFKKDKDSNGNPLPEEEHKILPFLKADAVFNLEQTEGIDPDKLPADAFPTAKEEPVQWSPEEIAEDLIKEAVSGGLVPEIKHDGGNRAFYRPSNDSVHLPVREQFETAEGYYGTAFHELAHATGHSTRLNRKLDTDPKPFGSADYSREELVAELASCFLLADCNMDKEDTVANHASYIESWSKKLKSDKKLFATASAQASKAHLWITGNFQTI